MYRLEVVHHRVFDELTDVRQLLIFKDHAVRASSVALIGILVLAEDELKLCLCQVAPEASKPDR